MSSALYSPTPDVHAIRVRTFPIILICAYRSAMYSTRLMNSSTPCFSQAVLRKRTMTPLDLP